MNGHEPAIQASQNPGCATLLRHILEQKIPDSSRARPNTNPPQFWHLATISLWEPSNFHPADFICFPVHLGKEMHRCEHSAYSCASRTLRVLSSMVFELKKSFARMGEAIRCIPQPALLSTKPETGVSPWAMWAAPMIVKSRSSSCRYSSSAFMVFFPSVLDVAPGYPF